MRDGYYNCMICRNNRHVGCLRKPNKKTPGGGNNNAASQVAAFGTMEDGDDYFEVSLKKG